MIDRTHLVYDNIIIAEPSTRGFIFNTEYQTYNCSRHGLDFHYSPRERQLEVTGKLYSLCRNSNLVGTLGEVWAGIQNENSYEDLDTILNSANELLNILTGLVLDIRSFRVTYIEVCFNIRLHDTSDMVGDYLCILNAQFEREDRTAYESYIRWRRRNTNDWRSPRTSFYIKTRTDFDRNVKTSKIMNFYDKHNQLCNIRQDNQNNEYRIQVSNRDLELARNVLRLEVQFGSDYLRRSLNSPTFDEFLNINRCSELLKEQYRWFVDRHLYCAFCSFDRAERIINNSTLDAVNKARIKDFCEMIRNNNVTVSHNTVSKYKQMLADIGIHWFILTEQLQLSESVYEHGLPSLMQHLGAHITDLKFARYDYLHGLETLTEIQQTEYDQLRIDLRQEP